MLLMSVGEVGHQGASVPCLRTEALSGGVRRVPAKPLVRHQLVQLGQVASIKGGYEAFDNLVDSIRRALVGRTGRLRQRLAAAKNHETYATDKHQPPTATHG